MKNASRNVSHMFYTDFTTARCDYDLQRSDVANSDLTATMPSGTKDLRRQE